MVSFLLCLPCNVVFILFISLSPYVPPRDGSLLFICISLFSVCFHPIVYLVPLFAFSQGPDPIAALTQRIQSLEQASSQNTPDIKSLLIKITNDGSRHLEDFDKHEALALAEQLAATSRL